jgi:hypothetical protein
MVKYEIKPDCIGGLIRGIYAGGMPINMGIEYSQKIWQGKEKEIYDPDNQNNLTKLCTIFGTTMGIGLNLLTGGVIQEFGLFMALPQVAFNAHDRHIARKNEPFITQQTEDLSDRVIITY